MAAVFASLAISGCREAREATPERKLASFAPVAAMTIGREPVRAFVQARTGLLVCGAAVTGATVVDGSWSIDFAAGLPADATIDLATAVAITADGYLLTCAHALVREPVFLCLAIGGDAAQVLPVRVVRSGDPRASASDVAILHVDMAFSATYAWADPAEISPGIPVIGWGRGGSAGRMVSAYKPQRRHGLTAMVACHDMPTCEGDSGGPVLTTSGAIIGITSRIKGTVGPYSGMTEIVRPDLEWLARSINRDRYHFTTSDLSRDSGGGRMAHQVASNDRHRK